MSHSIVRRLVVVLVLSALLGSPATSLAASRSHSAARHPRAQVAAQTPLSRLWNALVSGWEKAGCLIDPNGSCLPNSQENIDNGCGLEPYGKCTPGS